MKAKTTSLVLAALGTTLFLGACSSPSGDGAPSSSSALSAGAAATLSAGATPALVPEGDPRVAKVASDVLARVREVVATGRVERLGFSSPADLDRATLGAPIPVYFVTGAQALARTPGTDPHAVLGKPRELLYPILVNGVVTSEIVMADDASGGWSVFSVGGAETIRAIDRTTRGLAIGGHAPPVAVIEAHDVKVSLLAHEETGELTFTAFSDASSGGLTVGDRVPAETAFSKVSALAQKTVYPTDSCSGLPGEP